MDRINFNIKVLKIKLYDEFAIDCNFKKIGTTNFFAVPLMMFPRHMPGSRELRMNRSEEMHQDGLAKVMEKDEAFGTRWLFTN